MVVQLGHFMERVVPFVRFSLSSLGKLRYDIFPNHVIACMRSATPQCSKTYLYCL